MSSARTSELKQASFSGKKRRYMADQNPLSAKSVGDRLELIRAALDVTNVTLANMIGVSPQKWGNWKKGQHVIPHDAAARLCSVSGATTDFIYRDIRAHMTEGLAEKIARVEGNRRAIKRPKRA